MAARALQKVTRTIGRREAQRCKEGRCCLGIKPVWSLKGYQDVRLLDGLLARGLQDTQCVHLGFVRKMEGEAIAHTIEHL